MIELAISEREDELGRPLTRAEQKAWATIPTRDRKQYGIETHTWRDEVTARAAEHGLDRELVDDIVARGGKRLQRGELAVDGELEHASSTVGELELGDVLAGPAGLTARANTFDQDAVLREFAAAAAQGHTSLWCDSRPTGSPAATTYSWRPGAG